MDKLYKFYRYTRQNGVRKAVGKTRTYLARQTQNLKQPIDVMVAIEDVIKTDFVNNPYCKPARKPAASHAKIGWVLSPISAGSGGQNTIVRFARHLQQAGHDVTFYIYEGIQPQQVSQAKKILSDSFHFNVRVRKLGQYQDVDALIATGWETAYAVFATKTTAHKFYFVQDFEPMFYGTGSKTVLAESTYKMGFHGITAGRWLSHRLSASYGMECDFFDFGADLDIYRPATAASLMKQKKICFYARPVTERRAFELGVIALDLFHKLHPEYQIEFFGWDVTNFQIPFPYVNRGILSHEQLATLYQESVACLVLSLTNVSLLPLELLAAGCIPVMNEGDNNSMVLGNNDYIEYSSAYPVQLAQALAKVVAKPPSRRRVQTIADSVQAKSWQTSYQKVEKIITKQIWKA